MKFQLNLLIIIAISMMFLLPTSVEAESSIENDHINNVSTYVQIEAKKSDLDALGKGMDTDEDMDCNSLLGNPDNEDSVAWLLVKILNYVRILGPLAVIVLSGIEFTRTIVLSDDEAMKKTVHRLVIRLVLVALLFLVPTIVKVILQVFNIISDPMCGIE